MATTRFRSGTAYFLVGAIFLVLFSLHCLYQYGTARSEVIEVMKMEQVTTKSGESIKTLHLVSTRDNGVYKNVDSFMHFKFNSSTIWATLEEGKCYEVISWGWRIPFLSEYPNFDSPNQVNCDLQ